jgi:hypothetical protein
MGVEQKGQSSQTSQSGSPHPGHGTDGRAFVLLSIAVVAVVFVGMVGLLYWYEKPAPSSLLVLRVGERFDGAVATVDVADGRDVRPIVTTLEANKVVRINLPPGRYVVKIDHNGRRILEDYKKLVDDSYYPIDLSEASATQPASLRKRP